MNNKIKSNMEKKSDSQILRERIAEREQDALNRIDESLSKIFINVVESISKEIKKHGNKD